MPKCFSRRDASWPEPVAAVADHGSACPRFVRFAFVTGLSLMALVAGVVQARSQAPVAPVQAGAPNAAGPGQAAQPRLAKTGDARSGTLLLQRGDEAPLEALRLGTDIDVSVSGPTARARVTQMFQNPGTTHVEAIYVYPLPEGAAVDSLKMIVGERVIVATIKERQAAKAAYEAAKSNGRRAALMEQERANIFTNSVANIGPGETVVVQIEYQEPIRQSGVEFSLRLPLVVAPRYNPKPVVQTVDLSGGGWGRAVSDPVPDRDRIEPPHLDPRERAATNPVTITVRLAAGFPLADVKSHHHAVKIDSSDEARRIITLDAGAVPANKDFELTWKPVATQAPAVGLFHEAVGGADYVLAFVTPPALDVEQAPKLPREVILVIDNSGSMSGTSMGQAKASLQFALKRLDPEDRFNVVRFNHTMETLFSGSVAADAANIARAQAFVDALQATGGTEMLPALEAALIDTGGAESKHLRQVVFLTDGAIGNEQQLLDTIANGRGRSRIFTVGIGSAPNSFLMTRAAELGRGTFTHIGDVGQVEARMRGLFEKLEAPAVTGLSASFDGMTADTTPGLLPDLYRGEPLVLAAKLGGTSGTLEIKGNIGERPWVVRLPLANAAPGVGLSKVWARRKIADAEVARTLRAVTSEVTDKVVLALALEHHLVSRLTSLVAVDQEIARKPGEQLTRADVPLNLPAGWDFDKVFGPKGGERGQREIRAERPVVPVGERAGGQVQPTATRLAAAQPFLSTINQPVAHGVNLPRTATDAEMRLWAGLALLIGGLLLLGSGRRRHA